MTQDGPFKKGTPDAASLKRRALRALGSFGGALFDVVTYNPGRDMDSANQPDERNTMTF